jgi:hypothetical protein
MFTLTDQTSGSSQSRRTFMCRSAVIALATTSAGMLLASHPRKLLGAVTAGPASEADNFRSIQAHENDHVDFLVMALGKAARPSPIFQNLEQATFAEFVAVSQALENTGVGAYLNAAPFIDSMEYLAAAGSIALIEGRHAVFLNSFVGDPITGNALNPKSDNNFEKPLTALQVRTAAAPFVKNLNGGPPLAYAETPSANNDIAILNFALALEYLERDFYNINVPKFFGA